MKNPTNTSSVKALTTILECLQTVPVEEHDRILKSVAAYLNLSFSSADENNNPPNDNNPSNGTPSASKSPSLSSNATPKEFLRTKAPKTDVERVACLGYYLTHYRDTPHFKTLEISALNTEAAQPKFANAAGAMKNAVTTGYLAPAIKGTRQVSAGGEAFVEALPDREAAKQAMDNAGGRRKKKAKKTAEKKTPTKKNKK